MENEWAIMDDNGILYTGTEEGMRDAFKNSDYIYQDNVVKGDLKLIEIHGVKN